MKIRISFGPGEAILAGALVQLLREHMPPIRLQLSDKGGEYAHYYLTTKERRAKVDSKPPGVV